MKSEPVNLATAESIVEGLKDRRKDLDPDVRLLLDVVEYLVVMTAPSVVGQICATAYVRGGEPPEVRRRGRKGMQG